MLRVMARSGYERPRRNVSDQRDRFSERRVDGFALERKNCDDAFVDAVLRMPEPAKTRVFAVRRGEVARQDVLDEIAELEQATRQALEQSVLPERADSAAITKFLVHAYRDAWERGSVRTTQLDALSPLARGQPLHSSSGFRPIVRGCGGGLSRGLPAQR